jgi:hypothetical protein
MLTLPWAPYSSLGASTMPGAASTILRTPSIKREKSSGLQILNPPAHNADVDIVAVHGLGGDAFDTWTSSNGHLWLRDSLPQALETPPADYSHGTDDSKIVRVMTFGYDASVLTKASSQRSFTFAENLLSELKDRRHGQAVCSSEQPSITCANYVTRQIDR